jgi:hypothetical protein
LPALRVILSSSPSCMRCLARAAITLAGSDAILIVAENVDA